MKFLKNTILGLAIIGMAFNGSLALATTNSHSILLAEATTDYLSNVNGVDLSTDFSVSFWVKLVTEPSGFEDDYLISEYDSGTGGEGVGWWIRYTDAGATKTMRAFFSDVSGNNRSQKSYTVTAFGTSAWHHIVWTNDISLQATGILLYIDNVLQSDSGADNGSTTLGDPDDIIEIGARSETATVDARIDEVAIYRDILTSTEVQDLYLQEDDYCNLISTDANLAYYWSLNNTAVSVPDGRTLILNNSAAYSTTVPFASDSCAGAAPAVNNNQIF